MPSIPYGAGAYRRTGFPELKLVNMFVEASKTSEGGAGLKSRKGLASVTTVGSGPINGIFARLGVFSGDLFALSANSLYRAASLLGTIDGSGPVSFAPGEGELVLARGGSAYSYNGTDLAAITFPDSASVTAVAYIGSLFVYLRAGTQKFYWSAVLDGRTVDALSFASAERESDQLLDVIVLGDNLWLFGQTSVETWAHTGDSDLPFTRFEQSGFDKGLRATGCAVKADNSIYFVGSDSRLYRVADVPQRVSDHALEEKITASTACSLFAFTYEGHEYVCVRLDSETIALDVATGELCEFASLNQTNWIASCATMVGDEPRFGHSTLSTIMQLSGWDELGDPMERRFTAAMQLDEPVSLDTIKLWANAGQTALLSGNGSDPQVEMSLSFDGGNTYEEFEPEDLGPQGEYRTVPEWRACGMADFPGIMAQFRVTDPVDFRVSAVKANDPKGGRSR